MKTIDLKKAVAIVDEGDFDRINAKPWRLTTRGYAGRTEHRTKKKVNVMMHREVLGLTHDDAIVVDHINGNQLDNRRENLRVCTVSENLCNAKLYSSNKSGFKGVHQPAGSNRWTATICKNRKYHYLGSFSTPEEAYAARLKAEARFHGEFARSSDLLREAA